MRLRELFTLFLKIGVAGFGGPIAHIAMLQDAVVERRGWLSREEFLTGLSLCEMLPGPTSTEVAIYCGYRLAGLRGAIASGVAFILPAFLILLIFSALYFQWGSLPALRGTFRGLNPVVIAIITAACLRLGRSAIKELRQLGIAALACGAFLLLKPNILLLFALAGALGLLLFRRGAG